jgi:hypothetical protein
MNQACRPSAGQAHGHSSSVPPSNVGDPARVNLTAIIEMSDDMRFRSCSISVVAGDTVGFIVKNLGEGQA